MFSFILAIVHAACPPSTKLADAGGVMLNAGWGNAQFENEIWIPDTGYFASFEVNRVYPEFEDCEAKIFIEGFADGVVNIEGKGRTDTVCPAIATAGNGAEIDGV